MKRGDNYQFAHAQPNLICYTDHPCILPYWSTVSPNKKIDQAPGVWFRPLSSLTLNPKPLNRLSHPTWYEAMKAEYALLHNGTWSLVSLPPNRTSFG